jgi:hypothetical protein
VLPVGTIKGFADILYGLANVRMPLDEWITIVHNQRLLVSRLSGSIGQLFLQKGFTERSHASNTYTSDDTTDRKGEDQRRKKGKNKPAPYSGTGSNWFCAN